MKALKEFVIPYSGLKEGEHQFEYQINKAFFDFFNYDDFNSCDLKVAVKFVKKPTMFEIDFDISGSINVACDVTNELFDLPIAIKMPLLVKFGDEYNDENEDLLILPYSEYQLDISHYLYEIMVLAIPVKRVHPGVEDGTLKSDVLEKLKAYGTQPIRTQQKEENTNKVDPRWEKLKEIITDKNTD
ncbi:MAG: DUF177 domain-containing protein [Flavobacteriaceae bacterium]|nr:DUF177 domain-containing protein [Flavobacteriaceae bacterium]